MFSNKQKGKRICSEERNDKIKQRRCEMYRAMPADKREKNLLQRRRAFNQSRPQNPSSNFPGMAASSEFNSHLIREKLDGTPPSCPLQETVEAIHTACLTTLQNLQSLGPCAARATSPSQSVGGEADMTPSTCVLT